MNSYKNVIEKGFHTFIKTWGDVRSHILPPLVSASCVLALISLVITKNLSLVDIVRFDSLRIDVSFRVLKCIC